MSGYIVFAQSAQIQRTSGTPISAPEDNLINQQVVREFLSLSGISVGIANNGKEEVMALLENGV